MPDRFAPDAGYLLLEALVALAIVAMMSTLVFVTISQMSQSSSLVAERRRAMLLARSVLAAATVDSRTRAVASQGSDGDLAWSVSSDSWRPDDVGTLPLAKVTVTITDRAKGVRLIRLAGVKLLR